jgi:chromosomal replication initiator protein
VQQFGEKAPRAKAGGQQEKIKGTLAMTKFVAKGFQEMSGAYEDGVWNLVCGRMRVEIGETRFDLWIKPLWLTDVSAQGVEIGCPDTFKRDYVSQHYGETIAKAFRELAPELGPVKFTFATRPYLAVSNPNPQPLPHVAAGFSALEPKMLERLAPGSIPPNPAYTFDDFVTGKSNQMAAAAAQAASDRMVKGLPPAFNPLFLYGGSGLGKTHLMHSVVWEVLRNSQTARVMFITAENFLRRFLNAMKDRDMMTFKDELQSVDLLLVDDVQFIKDKNATQEEFFYRFNELIAMGKQVMFSADRSPAHLDGVAERIRQRMQNGVTLEVHPTDFELRLAILERKCERNLPHYKNVSIGEDVRRFLASKLHSNTRELEGALNNLFHFANTVGDPITLEVSKQVLSHMLGNSDRRVTVEEIKKLTASFYGIRVQDMDSPRRTRNLVRPRQVSMYLAKSLTQRSYPDIGRRFGNRDHTTVIHAVRQIERLSRLDPTLADEVEQLRRLLKDGGANPQPRLRDEGGPGPAA